MQWLFRYFYHTLNMLKALQGIEYHDALLSKKIKRAAEKKIACVQLASQLHWLWPRLTRRCIYGKPQRVQGFQTCLIHSLATGGVYPIFIIDLPPILFLFLLQGNICFPVKNVTYALAFQSLGKIFLQRILFLILKRAVLKS